MCDRALYVTRMDPVKPRVAIPAANPPDNATDKTHITVPDRGEWALSIANANHDYQSSKHY